MRRQPGRSPGPGGGGRRIPARQIVVAVAVLMITLLAVVDLTARNTADLVLVGLLGAGPCLAAVAAGPRAVLGVALYAMVLAVPLLIMPGQRTTPGREADNTLALVSVAAVSVVIAYRRHAFEQIAARAQQAQRVLAAVVESSEDAIVVRSLDGTITAWNRGAERMYGYRADEVIGQHAKIFATGPEDAELAGVLDRIGRDERVDLRETRHHRKDGSELDVSVRTSPVLDGTGTVAGASTIIRDITEQKRATARQRLADERSQQAQRLQSLGQLAGGIAHDFNNLLAVILNYTEFIAEQAGEDDPIRADAMKVRAAADRATALARQLLIFARGEPVQTEVFDLNTAVADAESMLTRTIGATINLVARPSTAAVMINADRGQVQQVLLNLVLNARDAMPDGGTLVIETSLAHLDETALQLQPALAPGSYARLLVSDTGIGMGAEVVRHVLEPFFTTKPKGHGTGLGLATVYGIVTQAGGGLNIYSELDLGTTVRVYVPAVDQAVATGEVPEAGEPPSGAGQTIIVAEDEDAIRQVVERILHGAGYHVLTANAGPAALVLLAAHRCDLLLTDVVMPEMSGRRLAELAHRREPGLPVLYMSGYSDGLLTDQRLLAEGSALLQKPFTAAELLRKVHRSMATRDPACGKAATPLRP